MELKKIMPDIDKIRKIIKKEEEILISQGLHNKENMKKFSRLQKEKENLMRLENKATWL